MKKTLKNLVPMLKRRMMVEIETGRHIICMTGKEATKDIATNLFRKPTDKEVKATALEMLQSVAKK